MMSEKKFFKMKEVCLKLGVAAHVIRFWEHEIPQLTFKKNGSGHRVFSHQDIATLENIKFWLHEDGLSLAGVRKKMQMKNVKRLKRPSSNEAITNFNKELNEELNEVVELVQEMIMTLDSP